MYMNCGPMTVTAGQKQWKRYEPAPKVSKRQLTFPDMFVANIGTCHTPESVDIIFPDSGADVQTVGNGPFTTMTCSDSGGGAAAAQQPTTAPVSGSPTSSGVTPTGSFATQGFASVPNGQYSQAASGADGSVPTSATTSSSFSNPGNQVIPVTPVGSPSATMSAPIYTNSSSIPQTAAPATTAPAAATAGSSVAPATGGASVGKLSGPCSSEGFWNCIDGSSFQRCASGAWSAAIPMSGMQCTPGESSDFVMTPVVKRFEGSGFREHFNESGFQTQVSHSHGYPTRSISGSWSPPSGSYTRSVPHHTRSTGLSASPSEY